MMQYLVYLHGLIVISHLERNKFYFLQVIFIFKGPFYKSTHWKQTLFYLEKSLKAKTGDYLRGSICVRKNKKNPREIDVKLSYKLDSDEKTKGI